MIEIKCTNAQKRRMIQAWQGPDGCLWPQKQKSCIFDPNAKCERCYEKRIKWSIVSRRRKS